MEIVVALAVAITVALALISWRIDKIPGRLFTLVKNDRARDDGQSQAILMEAAALKVGPLIAGIRGYHEQMEASLRAQLAEAETRARISERRASDASTYMEAASTLVTELRAEIEKLVRVENTRTLTEVERDESAMVAARLVSRTPPGTKSPEPSRSQTRFDLPAVSRQDAIRPPPPTASMNDSADWLLSERPSDADGERTRVGACPSPESLGLSASPNPPRSTALAKPTLLSMPVIPQPASRPVPPIEVKDGRRVGSNPHAGVPGPKGHGA